MLLNRVFMAGLAFALVSFPGCGGTTDPGAGTKGENRPSEPAVEPTPHDEELSASLGENVEVERAEQERQAEERLTDEAIQAVRETRNAVEALDDENREQAVEALERAVGKLEILLARKPELGLVPLQASTELVNPIVDRERVSAVRETVEKLIDERNFQAARRALEVMASEIRVTTVNLPLATYPAAIKEAARRLEGGKVEEAKQALRAALATLFLVERHVPLPVVNAEHLVELASEKAESEPLDALDLLTRAQEELKLAEQLGYGFRERDWADLDGEVRRLKEAIEARSESEGLFDALQENLRAFKARLTGARG